MKGVILAGGLGTRLYPLTKITNKHLLPVYDRPMILYPLETLKQSGVKDILIVCGKEYAGDFMNFLGSGREFGVNLSFAIQDKDNGGIADALSYAEGFADSSPVAVILGDNIFEHPFGDAVRSFEGGATVFFKEVSDPERFGVPVFSEDGKEVVRIEEKPKDPKSPYAQVGMYLFDQTVFPLIKNLEPSERGELEVSDLVNKYIEKRALSFLFITDGWLDAGTVESLYNASSFVREKKL